MENNFIIRREEEKDYRETENLVRESFWNVYRPGCAEHYVLHRMRGCPEFVDELDFVMEKNGKIIGQTVFARGGYYGLRQKDTRNDVRTYLHCSGI